MSSNQLTRRKFLSNSGVLASGILTTACSPAPSPDRYNQADRDLLAQQRSSERNTSGMGQYGRQQYPGYRGLARLPWFKLDNHGELVCWDEEIPRAIDMHSHLGISVLLSPDIDLHARTPRVHHLLDCDAVQPGCELDLDVYANSNFTEAQLGDLRISTLAQGLWGSPMAKTQTIPNLLAEMDAMRVERACILPIKMGLPFGDNLTGKWRDAIKSSGTQDRLLAGLSIHPRDKSRLKQMRAHAAAGARVMKLHPTVQAFYPDDPDMMPVYETAQALGLCVFFHGGRAGIEPESRQRYAMPRHYEAVLAEFPRMQVILGHAGARDADAMVRLASRYDNAWLGIHGQSVTVLDAMIENTGSERLLFGSDWPFYHIGMSLAKVLLCTETGSKRFARARILRENALQLLSMLGQD